MNHLLLGLVIAAAIVLVVFFWRGSRTRRVKIADLPLVPVVPGEKLFPARVGERWGYMNARGQLVIRPRWDDAGPFAEGLAAVGSREVQQDGGISRTIAHQGYIDERGEEVIAPRFNDAKPFKNALARVSVDGKHGFIDRTGREVVPIAYEDAADFSEGVAAVKKDGKTGFVDERGQVVIPFLYERAAWISSFRDGLACAFVSDGHGGDRAGLIDCSGKFVIEPQFFFAQPFSEGLALVKRMDEPYLFIDRTGKRVIEIDAVDALSFQEGLAPVQLRDASGQLAWSYLDPTGKAVLADLRYRYCGVFREGRAGIQDEKTRGWGFIDRTGRVVIAPDFTGISLFENGLARMETGSLFGGLQIVYIDPEGRVVWREP